MFRGAAPVVVLLLGVTPAYSQAVQPASAAAPGPGFDIEGRFMFWQQGAEQPLTGAGRQFENDFMLRRARLVVQGRVSDALTVHLQLGQDNVGARCLAPDGGVVIKDAYVNFRVAEPVQFAAGQFKVPFLRANLESGFNQLLVDRGTLPTLRPAREGSRDVGVMAWGDLRQFQYRVAMLDGSDQESSAHGRSVRLTARIARNWFTAERGLGYTGTYLGVRRVLHVAVQADMQERRADARDDVPRRTAPRDYTAWAAELFWEQPLGTAAVTAEAAWSDRRDDYVEAGIQTRQIAGSYVQAGMLLPRMLAPGRLQLALRREAWTTEREMSVGETRRTVVGGTYYVRGHSQKIQADYTFRREVPESPNDELRASLVVVF